MVKVPSVSLDKIQHRIVVLTGDMRGSLWTCSRRLKRWTTCRRSCPATATSSTPLAKVWTGHIPVPQVVKELVIDGRSEQEIVQDFPAVVAEIVVLQVREEENVDITVPLDGDERICGRVVRRIGKDAGTDRRAPEEQVVDRLIRVLQQYQQVIVPETLEVLRCADDGGTS